LHLSGWISAQQFNEEDAIITKIPEETVMTAATHEKLKYVFCSKHFGLYSAQFANFIAPSVLKTMHQMKAN